VFEIDELLKIPSIKVDWSSIIFMPMTKPTSNRAEFFEFPNKSMRDEYQKTNKDVWLAGFYCKNTDDSKYLNFVLSDGHYTTPVTDQIRFIMPEECKSPRYVKVYLSESKMTVEGIAYLDKYLNQLFRIGNTSTGPFRQIKI
jgi:hypothetical protein